MWTTILGGSLVGRIVADVVRSDVTDRSMTLAAQAFTSILPVMILLSTLPGSAVLDAALAGFDLDRADLALASPSDSQSFTFGIFGALMTLVSATSFSRALDRMYSAVWHLPRLRIDGWWRWLVVLLTIACGVAMQGVAAQLRSLSYVGIALETIATFVTWTLSWWIISRVLTSGAVPTRYLVINGAVTGSALTVLVVATHAVLPRTLDSATRQFGTLGIIFSVIGWLFVFAAIVVTSTVVVHTVADDAGPVGQRLRARPLGGA